MISTVIGEGGEAAFYRVIVPAHARTPLSGIGAARQGGRFNRSGQEALYLSLDEVTALADYRQDNPWLRPGTISTFFVCGLEVADLKRGYDSDRWPIFIYRSSSRPSSQLRVHDPEGAPR